MNSVFNNHCERKKEKKVAQVAKFMKRLGGEFNGTPKQLNKLMKKTLKNIKRRLYKKEESEKVIICDYKHINFKSLS